MSEKSNKKGQPFETVDEYVDFVRENSPIGLEETSETVGWYVDFGLGVEGPISVRESLNYDDCDPETIKKMKQGLDRAYTKARVEHFNKLLNEIPERDWGRIYVEEQPISLSATPCIDFTKYSVSYWQEGTIGLRLEPEPKLGDIKTRWKHWKQKRRIQKAID